MFGTHDHHLSVRIRPSQPSPNISVELPARFSTLWLSIWQFNVLHVQSITRPSTRLLFVRSSRLRPPALFRSAMILPELEPAVDKRLRSRACIGFTSHIHDSSPFRYAKVIEVNDLRRVLGHRYDFNSLHLIMLPSRTGIQWERLRQPQVKSLDLTAYLKVCYSLQCNMYTMLLQRCFASSL